MKLANSILETIKSNRAISLIVFVAIIVFIHAYFFNKYQVADAKIKQVVFTTNIDQNDLLVYVTLKDAISTNFARPFKPKLVDHQFVFYLDSIESIRKFRIYIGRETDSTVIENIYLILENEIEPVLLSDFSCHDINLIGKKQNDFLLFSSNPNGYLELKKERISLLEYLIAEVLIFVISSFIFLLCVFLFLKQLSAYTKSINWKELLSILFISSIFLPLPIFNVTFFLSFAFIVKDFQYDTWRYNKMGLLFIGYFLIFLINNFFVSSVFNSKILETSIPLFALPFYFACVPKESYLKFFPISAFLISLYFISTSTLDAVLHSNIECFSFDGFTKYVHPVYFSYLLFFSIIFIEFDSTKTLSKKVFHPILLFALLCCGSKLIISLTILFYAFQFFKTRIVFGSLFIVVSIVFVLLFSPTRKRFQEIFNISSLSVLSEYPIKSNKDGRLTGLTIRLIIWQESLHSLSTIKDVLLGKGVDSNSNKMLEERLSARGLERGHVKYDPHNQFIATYYKLGIIGLMILLSICVYGYVVAIKQKNQLLFYSMILFSVAMFTESVLQRVVGIYFFTSILLILFFLTVKPSHPLESSDIRN